MHPYIRYALATLFIAALASTSQAQGAQLSPAPLVGPLVGSTAPDFTAQWADASGTKTVSLASLKGKVVVLAFYPLDRSSGCTIELSKFRDDYKTLFGDGVVVLPASIDSLGSHTSWAKDAHFPFGMISDPTYELANKYGSIQAGKKTFARTIFVIGKDGKVSYASMRFNVQAQDQWDTLAQEIKRAKSA